MVARGACALSLPPACPPRSTWSASRWTGGGVAACRSLAPATPCPLVFGDDCDDGPTHSRVPPSSPGTPAPGARTRAGLFSPVADDGTVDAKTLLPVFLLFRGDCPPSSSGYHYVVARMRAVRASLACPRPANRPSHLHGQSRHQAGSIGTVQLVRLPWPLSTSPAPRSQPQRGTPCTVPLAAPP
jgi:hypothetical protein